MSEASLAQQRAASPHASTWLSANAGSGKTRVLTERVARLLLLGAPPENILCLTYTKAAASEMQNRLFNMLGSWAMMKDADLRAALDKIAAPDDLDLDRARRLFAQAIETPGGLKIQTIHSFCAALLRRFPLEAGIAADFVEMEDSAREKLMREAVRAMADTPEMAALGTLVSDTGLDRLLGALARSSAQLETPWDENRARRDLGIGPKVDQASIVADLFADNVPALISRVAAAMQTDTPTQAKKGAVLGALNLRAEAGPARLQALAEVICTKGSGYRQPASRFLTKAVRTALGSAAEAFDDLGERIGLAQNEMAALKDLDAARIIHTFGHAFVTRYGALKTQRGALDFDDLIEKTEALLTSGAGQWVAFRLDGEIDHILVDEAQDTSPAQWRVIAALASELVSGTGARDIMRTIFVVGDKKQSIYSFQGADPAEFDRMRDDFAARLAGQSALATADLKHSFRSAPAILKVVDETFAQSGAALGHEAEHLAFDLDRPGRVDVWPALEKDDGDKTEPDFEDPVDRLEPDHPVVQLAAMIAREVRWMVEAGQRPDGKGGWQRIDPGDVMILLQRRSGLFHHIIRACKAEGLPIAGADRFHLGNELAVKDLVSLLAFLSFADDNLALAEVLKSPLCGLSEADLLELAHGRGDRTLWQVLRDQEHAFPKAHAMLTSLLNDAEYLRPFEMLERILTRHEGRARLIGRLGEEARDGIDELLAQALRYETLGPPSLTQFVEWVRREATEVKRGLDGSTGQVRVMTVHGAKGLEAPIVILPDTIRSSKGKKTPPLSRVGNTVCLTGSAQTRSEAIEAVEDARKASEEEEAQRLLYVAMTRAEHWLIVCGGSGEAAKPEDWISRVQSGVLSAGGAALDTPNGEGVRFATGEWPDFLEAIPIEPVGTSVVLPDWIDRPAPVVKEAATIISPSDLPGAKWLAGDEGNSEGRAFGTLVHGLLEQSEARDFEALARALAPELPEDVRQRAVDEARGVLGNPDFGDVFSREALAEVSISAPLGDAILRGQIDRLLVTPERILIVDFKTNRTVPDTVEHVPAGLLAQLGAYALAVHAIYPGKPIETAILWTAAMKLQSIGHDTVMGALQRATTS